MEKIDAITALGALAQETRLDIFRYLVGIGPQGVPAGQIGERFELPAATLSFHLKTLRQAGLLECRREGRSLIYSASYATMSALLAYLTENCCGVPWTVSGCELTEPVQPMHKTESLS
jgi:DNA-binding transcriptional ArsR family regulator